MRFTPEGKPSETCGTHGVNLAKECNSRMSIRMVAAELYRVMKELEQLEKELGGLKPGSPERVEIEGKIREGEAEKIRLKKMLDGSKDDEASL